MAQAALDHIASPVPAVIQIIGVDPLADSPPLGLPFLVAIPDGLTALRIFDHHDVLPAESVDHHRGGGFVRVEARHIRLAERMNR